jgi:hypothetical protein
MGHPCFLDRASLKMQGPDLEHRAFIHFSGIADYNQYMQTFGWKFQN